MPSSEGSGNPRQIKTCQKCNLRRPHYTKHRPERGDGSKLYTESTCIECFKQKEHDRESRSPERRIWLGMKARCLNKKHKYFDVYGGRGITVCARWINSFEAFLEDMGARPTIEHSIDRIDNDGNYEPMNVRWALAKVQARNRSSNRYITFNGLTLSISEWAERTGLSKVTIRDRIERAGWSIDRALTARPRKKADSTHQRRATFRTYRTTEAENV